MHEIAQHALEEVHSEVGTFFRSCTAPRATAVVPRPHHTIMVCYPLSSLAVWVPKLRNIFCATELTGDLYAYMGCDRSFWSSHVRSALHSQTTLCLLTDISWSSLNPLFELRRLDPSISILITSQSTKRQCILVFSVASRLLLCRPAGQWETLFTFKPLYIHE